MKMDSTEATNKHRNRVRDLLILMAGMLEARGEVHDLSKLGPDEKPGFDEFTPKLAGSTYGSEEYKGFLAGMKEACLDHHYAVNSHHPEHFALWKCPRCKMVLQKEPKDERCPNCRIHPGDEGGLAPHVGVEGMTLLDLVEMMADWKAASERHEDGDIMRSLRVNAERFSISPQLLSILENTAREMGWMK